MKLSIIVPCYNESKNIPLILEKFSNVIKRDDVEVLLVNNGSKDNSQEILNEAKGEFIGYTHADMQTDPADPLKALEIIEMQSHPEKCYVKGDRKKRPLFDQFFTIGMSLFETLYLGMKLWDINAQPNIFHRSFFKKIKGSCPKDFSLDLYLLYMAKKYELNIIRFNVVFTERMHGKSSWNTGLVSKWKFIKRTFDFSVKLKKEL